MMYFRYALLLVLLIGHTSIIDGANILSLLDNRYRPIDRSDDFEQLPTANSIGNDFLPEGSQTMFSCYMIDISECDNRKCLLGYQKDSYGCVISCNCAREGLFEGDIIVTESELPALYDLYDGNREGKQRGASTMNSFRKRWNNLPDGNGNYIVPYKLHPNLRGKPKMQALILQTIADYNANTCIRLKPNAGEPDYLLFKFERGCSSRVGKTSGPHIINLGLNCLNKGSFIHEVMHALGFFHEQSRPDRDSFVKILFKNVLEEFMENMNKMSTSEIDSLGSPYDLTSVMQYGGAFFSKNGRPTILDAKTNKPVFAQRNGFSSEDIKQINAMYKCS